MSAAEWWDFARTTAAVVVGAGVSIGTMLWTQSSARKANRNEAERADLCELQDALRDWVDVLRDPADQDRDADILPMLRASSLSQRIRDEHIRSDVVSLQAASSELKEVRMNGDEDEQQRIAVRVAGQFLELDSSRIGPRLRNLG